MGTISESGLRDVLRGLKVFLSFVSRFHHSFVSSLSETYSAACIIISRAGYEGQIVVGLDSLFLSSGASLCGRG